MCARDEIQPFRDHFLKSQQHGRAEDQPGNESLEGSSARAQEKNRPGAPADERWDRKQQEPSTHLRQVMSKADHSGERTGPERRAIGRVGQNRIASDPYERREGDQRATAGDGIDDAGDKRRRENDDAGYRSPSATYRSLIVRSASYAYDDASRVMLIGAIL